ncbi:unnamed protein product [Nesidiocoris tenuis]|uniref:Uncharacterized protein n=1 Tax=Nesidiocoris tenuis TaxID=355587 RepID=A0A6H5HER6_9HEMI|nr:unnamed protein product [Nesidiocoris tenuis]
MEDSIETCHIQAAFDNYKGPLIGLEYIVELVNLEDKSEPRYICLLCEKRGDPRSVMVHVTSQNHYFKYICCFFRTVGNLLNLTTLTSENKKGYGIAIRLVAAEIEKHYGRLKPTSAAAETFAQKKHEILKAIDEREHFRETPSTTFTHLVTPEKLQEYNNMKDEDMLKPITRPLEELRQPSSLNFAYSKARANKVNDRGQNGGSKRKVDPDVVVIDDEPSDRRRSLSPVSSVDSMGREKRPDRKSSRSRESSSLRRSPDRRRRRSRSRSRSRDRYRDLPRRRRRSRSPGLRRSRSPGLRRSRSPGLRRSRSPGRRLPERSLHDRKRREEDYRRDLAKLETEIEHKLKYYEDRPEKHPLYNEEWKSFWNKRYKEVQQEGRDPNSFDFKPEWIIFWGQRVKQIHKDELRLKSEELREQLGLNTRDERSTSGLVDISPPSSEDEKEVTVQDIRNTWKGLTGTDLSGPPGLATPAAAPPVRRMPSPHREEPRPLSPPGRMGCRGEVVPPTVHCLRLFTVLEHLLGSLAPRVIELLSKALILEREAVGSSMELLNEPEVHVFFDTVSEKIRALLITGIVDRHLVNAARSVVNATQKMLRHNPPKKTMKPSPLFAPHPSHPPPSRIVPQAPIPVPTVPSTLPGMGFVDKMAVAQQIASALVTQGRTDVSEQELEELINAVVGIAQASNATFNTNTSSTSFFSQLNMANSTAGARINDILSSMIKDATGKSGAGPASNLTLEVKAEPNAGPKFPPDEELKEKLVKFNMLEREEQQSLIALLKELEKTEPKRVEDLRKYVSVGLSKTKEELELETQMAEKEKAEKEKAEKEKAAQPATVSKEDPEKPLETVASHYKSEDDDDDDYSFEDVYKAASEKLKKNEDPAGKSAAVDRATPTLKAPEATPASSMVADLESVFGPQRNPAEVKPATSSAPISFNPKNSAPDVSDPNSQMSLDDIEDQRRTPMNPSYDAPPQQADFSNSVPGYGHMEGQGMYNQRTGRGYGGPPGFGSGYPPDVRSNAPYGYDQQRLPHAGQDSWFARGSAPPPPPPQGDYRMPLGGYNGPGGANSIPFQGNKYPPGGNQGYGGNNYGNPGSFPQQRNNSNYPNSSNQYQNWNY